MPRFFTAGVVTAFALAASPASAFAATTASAGDKGGLDELLNAKQLLSISGALWAVFGVVVFGIVKDVALAERTRAVSEDVRAPALNVLRAFFTVNFGAMFVIQSYGLSKLPADPFVFQVVVCLGHIASLVLYLMMAVSTLRASEAALLWTPAPPAAT